LPPLPFAPALRVPQLPADPLEVQVVEAQQKDVPLYQEWIGTLEGFTNADIKAQGVGFI
jgi:membrane fusion protein (multidrug efflux system)